MPFAITQSLCPHEASCVSCDSEAEEPRKSEGFGRLATLPVYSESSCVQCAVYLLLDTDS